MSDTIVPDYLIYPGLIVASMQSDYLKMAVATHAPVWLKVS